MLVCLVFMPLDPVHNVPLNGFRKWVATHHKTLIVTWMDEFSSVLDSWHWITTKVTPAMFPLDKNCFIQPSLELGLHKGVNFSKNWLGWLWIVCSCRNWPNTFSRSYGTHLYQLVWFLCLQTQVPISCLYMDVSTEWESNPLSFVMFVIMRVAMCLHSNIPNFCRILITYFPCPRRI